MNKCCAGIVTFQPNLNRLKDNINSLSRQFKNIYIVDNHSSNYSELGELVSLYADIILIGNEDNCGIAKALNQLMEAARNDGYDWLITMDQDTVLPFNLKDSFSKYMDNSTVGIICPAVDYEGLNKTTLGDDIFEYVTACMTSASLTRIAAWEKVGGYREDYFIDFVDNEFCMKLRINGYKILRDNECVMSHQLGDTQTKKILGIIPITFSNHSPLRIYYMTRNNYSFIREYKMYLPVLKEYIKLLYIVLSNLIWSDNKAEVLKLVIKGYRDGKNNRLGPYADCRGEI